MGRWYAALKETSETAFDDTDKTDKTPHEGVSSVLSVPHLGKSENFQPTARGSVSFVSSANDRIQIFEAVAKSSPETDPAHGDPGADADQYADALRQIGPCGYGPIAVVLGWGMTRTANAEEALRKAGSIIYDGTGRGRLA
jgi:hypothetical protein